MPALPENLTPRALQALDQARVQATQMGHDTVGTEHLLLGLVQLHQGVAVAVLKSTGLDLDTLRAEVLKHTGISISTVASSELELSPTFITAIDYAAEEAKNLNYNYVGTEHLLLGLIRVENGLAFRILKSQGVDAATVRLEVLKGLDPHYLPPES